MNLRLRGRITINPNRMPLQFSREQLKQDLVRTVQRLLEGAVEIEVFEENEQGNAERENLTGAQFNEAMREEKERQHQQFIRLMGDLQRKRAQFERAIQSVQASIRTARQEIRLQELRRQVLNREIEAIQNNANTIVNLEIPRALANLLRERNYVEKQINLKVEKIQKLQRLEKSRIEGLVKLRNCTLTALENCVKVTRPYNQHDAVEMKKGALNNIVRIFIDLVREIASSCSSIALAESRITGYLNSFQDQLRRFDPDPDPAYQDHPLLINQN